MPPHPSTIIRDRDIAMAQLQKAIATELGVPVADDVIAAERRWRVVAEAEKRYCEWSLAMQGIARPVMRSKADIALSNLYGIDHQPPFAETAT